MKDLFNYRRRETSVVNIGATPLGGVYPIRVQSMTNTPTQDTEACVKQAKKIIVAGADYVRLTTQGVREAENLRNINAALRSQGIMTPLVADVHFNPNVADVAALYAEKVRINPGNYVDAARTFKKIEYTDEEYAAELKRLRERFLSFLDICRANHTAIRIGVNHGSLSDRIMSRYGDTPHGIVESCMEFLRICRETGFDDVVISVKASNTAVMVQSVRLLVSVMEQEGMNYPLHLGVTEAGDGEDGRVKSALGIGALLADGYGDTVRVSLSEAPEKEIPVARKLVDYVVSREGHMPIPGRAFPGFDPLAMSARETWSVGNIGGGNVPVVISFDPDGAADEADGTSCRPDYIYTGGSLPAVRRPGQVYMVDYPAWTGEENTYPVFSYDSADECRRCRSQLKFMFMTYVALDDNVMSLLREDRSIVLISQSNHPNRQGEHRALVHELMNGGCKTPVAFFQHYAEDEAEDLQIKAAADMGALVFDGFCNGIFLLNGGSLPRTVTDSVAFAILQAGRLRMTKTEYISCPGCGRTLYDLEKTIARVKAATCHLKGLKIGIMGCIVNGPGEMADADYGYVGAGRGKISLYKGKVCVEKNIPEDMAVEKLIQLIKDNGDYRLAD